MPGFMPGIHVFIPAERKDMDGRDKCLARGHDRHLFGDMTDTFVLGQVDVCNFISTEEDAVLT
ncbi:MAG: hypothetical protein WB764_03980, partial [Xanthobacteraceae bacterium]